MKTKSLTLIAAVLFATATLAPAATNDLSSALQKGLFEEEANHNLDAAIAAYQSVATQFDKDRKLAATAIFRLGEVYRKQGKTNEANAQYERILREFSDQPELVKLSRDYQTSANAKTDAARLREIERNKAEIARLRPLVAAIKAVPATNKAEYLEALFSNQDLLNPLINQRNILRTQLEILLKSKTEDNTDVLRAKDQLAAAQKQIEDQIEKFVAGAESALIRDENALKQLEASDETPLGGMERLLNARTLIASKPQASDEDLEIARIKTMIKDSPDLINAQTTGLTEDVGTPLHKAAAEGQLAVANFLLANGADIERKSKAGYSPLYFAAKSGNKSMVELLLEHGANPSTEGFSGTPLHAAAQSGFKAVMEVLIAHKAPIDAVNYFGQTALHLAAENKQTGAAELLISKGANVNIQDRSGANALLTAVWSGSPEITKLLLEHGGDPNVAVGQTLSGSETYKIFYPNWGNADAPEGLTALPLAIKKERLKIVEILLEGGVSPNAEKGQMPPLYVALNHGKKFVEILLQHKADPNATISGMPLLNVAVQNGTPEIAEMLMAHGANVNGKQEDNGATPLLTAIQKGNLETIEQLLKNKADPNILYKNGETALGIVKRGYTRSGREVLIDLLLKYGADENFERRTQIAVMRDGTQRYVVFNKGNSWNRFSLLEAFGDAISPHYASTGQTFAPLLPFPNLAKVKIHRLEAKGEREIPVDLEAILKSGDCSKDIWLEWGDVIEIPEKDHKLDEQWRGFPKEILEMVPKCLGRNVSISVKGESKPLLLAPKLKELASSAPAVDTRTGKPIEPQKWWGIAGLDFWLHDVVSNSSLLRTSSDKTRVKVTRINPVTKKSEEQIFNLEKPDPQNNLWLRDDDQIEIPEKP